MPIRVAIIGETQAGEHHVAIVPSVAASIKKLGAEIFIQSGAGEAAKLPDSAFRDVAFAPDAKSLVGGADIVLAVQPPPTEVVQAMREGATLISFIYAASNPVLAQLQKSHASPWARVPRISRA